MLSPEEFDKLSMEEKLAHVKSESGIDIGKIQEEEGISGLQVLGGSLFMQVEEVLEQERELMLDVMCKNEPMLRPLYKMLLEDHIKRVKEAAIQEGKFDFVNELMQKKQ